MIILNYKNYPESLGNKGAALTTAVNNFVTANPDFAANLIVAPQTSELGLHKHLFPNLEYSAQHVDNKPAGSSTGWVTGINVKASGVNYTLLNHSEHRVTPEKLTEEIVAATAAGLKVVACVENVEEAMNLLTSMPFAIAYEPAELIGSGRSVSSEKPEVVADFVKALEGSGVLPFIGAGISNGNDVKVGLELGAKGFLLASAYVKAADPMAILTELTAPYKK